MLRLEALRAFVEVAEHGNIKDASERLYRTPSALSMTLKQIEDRLGCPLFETDRKSTLTEMGRFLYDQSVVLLRDYDRAMERIAAQSKARSGRLRIASVSIARRLNDGSFARVSARMLCCAHAPAHARTLVTTHTPAHVGARTGAIAQCARTCTPKYTHPRTHEHALFFKHLW
jgi:hypothetical protein